MRMAEILLACLGWCRWMKLLVQAIKKFCVPTFSALIRWLCLHSPINLFCDNYLVIRGLGFCGRKSRSKLAWGSKSTYFFKNKKIYFKHSSQGNSGDLTACILRAAEVLISVKDSWILSNRGKSHTVVELKVVDVSCKLWKPILWIKT